MLCKKCHWYENKKPFKGCDFCDRLDFPEDILCSITRNGSEEGNLLECGAYRPKLSLASSDQQNAIEIEKTGSKNIGLTNKEKWLVAYSKQQLQLNPEEIHFKLQFHICLISNSRNVIFSSSDKHIEKIKNIFNKIAISLENTRIEVLWVGSDHIHLYVNTTPDYSLDEIANKLIKISEREIIIISPGIVNESNGVWEVGYFAETIG